jgi:hypothetical protein
VLGGYHHYMIYNFSRASTKNIQLNVLGGYHHYMIYNFSRWYSWQNAHRYVIQQSCTHLSNFGKRNYFRPCCFAHEGTHVPLSTGMTGDILNYSNDKGGGHRGRNRMEIEFTYKLVNYMSISPLVLWVRMLITHDLEDNKTIITAFTSKWTILI